jgi:hypothetical protein
VGVKSFLCYADYSPCAARLVRLYDLAHGVGGIFYVNAITDLYGRGCVFVYKFHGVSLIVDKCVDKYWGNVGK